MTKEERQLLADLEALSEAPAANLQEGKSRGKAESRPLNSRQLGQDLEDQSLYLYYKRKLEKASSPYERRLIVRAGRRAYDLRVKGAARAKLPSTTTRQNRDEEREARWVLEHGRGIDSALIAADLEVPRGWVEKVRRENRLRPRDGEPVPGFLGWDDERRTKEVVKLQRRGMKQEQVAAQLGVTRQTISRYWER